MKINDLLLGIQSTPTTDITMTTQDHYSGSSRWSSWTSTDHWYIVMCTMHYVL